MNTFKKTPNSNHAKQDRQAEHPHRNYAHGAHAHPAEGHPGQASFEPLDQGKYKINLRTSAEGKGAIRVDPIDAKKSASGTSKTKPANQVFVGEGGHHHKTHSLHVNPISHHQPLNSQPSSKYKAQQLIQQQAAQSKQQQVKHPPSAEPTTAKGYHLKNQKSMPIENPGQVLSQALVTKTAGSKIKKSAKITGVSHHVQAQTFHNHPHQEPETKFQVLMDFKKGTKQEAADLQSNQMSLANSKKPHIVMNQDFHVKKKNVGPAAPDHPSKKSAFEHEPTGMSPSSHFKHGVKISQIKMAGAMAQSSIAGVPDKSGEQPRKINPSIGHKKANSLMNQKIIAPLLNREPSVARNQEDEPTGAQHAKIISTKQISGQGGTFQGNAKPIITKERQQNQIISFSVDNSQELHLQQREELGRQPTPGYIPVGSQKNSSSATPSTTYQLLSNGNEFQNVIRTATQQTTGVRNAGGQMARSSNAYTPAGGYAGPPRGSSEGEEVKQGDKNVLQSSFGRTSSRHLKGQQPKFKHKSFHHNPNASSSKPMSKHKAGDEIPSTMHSGIIPPGFMTGHPSIGTNSSTNFLAQSSKPDEAKPVYAGHHRTQSDAAYVQNLQAQNPLAKNPYVISSAQHVISKKGTTKKTPNLSCINKGSQGATKGLLANKGSGAQPKKQSPAHLDLGVLKASSNSSAPAHKKGDPKSQPPGFQQKVTDAQIKFNDLTKFAQGHTQDHRHSQPVSQQDYLHPTHQKSVSSQFGQVGSQKRPIQQQPLQSSQQKKSLKAQVVHPPYPKTTQQTLEPPQNLISYSKYGVGQDVSATSNMQNAQNQIRRGLSIGSKGSKLSYENNSKSRPFKNPHLMQVNLSQSRKQEPSPADFIADSRSAGCMALGTINSHCEDAAEAEFNMVIQSDNHAHDSSYQGLSKDTTPRDIIRTFNGVEQPNFILHQPVFQPMQSAKYDEMTSGGAIPPNFHHVDLDGMKSDLDEESAQNLGKMLNNQVQSSMISRTDGQGPLAMRMPHFSDDVAIANTSLNKRVVKKPASSKKGVASNQIIPHQPQQQVYIGGPPSSSSGSFAGKSHKRSVSDGGIFNNQGLKAKASQMTSQNNGSTELQAHYQGVPVRTSIPTRKKDGNLKIGQKAHKEQVPDPKRAAHDKQYHLIQYKRDNLLGTDQQMEILEEGDDEQREDNTATQNTQEDEENVRTEMGQEHLTSEGQKIMQPSGSFFAVTGAHKRINQAVKPKTLTSSQANSQGVHTAYRDDKPGHSQQRETRTQPQSMHLMCIEENTPTAAQFQVNQLKKSAPSSGPSSKQVPQKGAPTRVKKAKPKSNVSGIPIKKLQQEDCIYMKAENPSSVTPDISHPGSELTHQQDSKDGPHQQQSQFVMKAQKYKQMRKSGEHAGTVITNSLGTKMFESAPRREFGESQMKNEMQFHKPMPFTHQRPQDSQIGSNFESQTQDRRKEAFKPLDVKHRRVKSGAAGIEAKPMIAVSQQKGTGRHTNMKAEAAGKLGIFQNQKHPTSAGPRNAGQTKPKKPAQKQVELSKDDGFRNESSGENQPIVFNYPQQQQVVPPNNRVIQRQVVEPNKILNQFPHPNHRIHSVALEDEGSDGYPQIGDEGFFYDEESSANVVNMESISNSQKIVIYSHGQSVDVEAVIGGVIGFDQNPQKKVINVSFNDFPSISNGDNFSQSGAITEGQNESSTPLNHNIPIDDYKHSGRKLVTDKDLPHNQLEVSKQGGAQQQTSKTQQSSNNFNKLMQQLEKIKPENPSAQSPLNQKVNTNASSQKEAGRYSQQVPKGNYKGIKIKPSQQTDQLHQMVDPNKIRAMKQQMINQSLHGNKIKAKGGHKKTQSEAPPILNQQPAPSKPMSVSSGKANAFSASSGGVTVHQSQIGVQFQPAANQERKQVRTISTRKNSGSGISSSIRGPPEEHKQVLNIFHPKNMNFHKYPPMQNINSPSGSNTGGQPSPIISMKRIPQKHSQKSKEPSLGIRAGDSEKVPVVKDKNLQAKKAIQNNYVVQEEEYLPQEDMIMSDYLDQNPQQWQPNEDAQPPQQQWIPENILRKKNINSQSNQTTSTPIIPDRVPNQNSAHHPKPHHTQEDEDYGQGAPRPVVKQQYGAGIRQKSPQPSQKELKSSKAAAAQKKRQTSGSELYQMNRHKSDNDFGKKTPDEISDLDHLSDNDPVNLIHNLNKDHNKRFVYDEEDTLPDMTSNNEVERIKIIHKPMPKQPGSGSGPSAHHSKKPSNFQAPASSMIQHPVAAPVQTPKAPQVSERKDTENSHNALTSHQAPPNSQLRGTSVLTTGGERLVTEESNNNQLTPRSKGIRKLIKMIRLCFKQSPPMAPETTIEFYRIGKILGKGAFGKVNLAVHKLTQSLCAVKSINKQCFSDESQTRKVMQEVFMLKKVKHQNIVRLFEYFETEKHILFVIELCAGGDLLNYVRRRRRLKEDIAKCLFKQIVESLAYCHSKNILHRDIKLDNILLDQNGLVKLCDFGVGKMVKKGEKMTEQCGTPAYIAPEIIRDEGYYGFAVDIWSAGVVLYAMLYGTVPFKASNMQELQKIIKKAKYSLKEDISAESRDLLKCLLEKDPLKRITIAGILAHPWLKDAPDPKDVELFSEQERQYIKGEYSYSKSTRHARNREMAGLVPTDASANPFEQHDINQSHRSHSELDRDMFTEHMLDSTQNSILKNCETKSIILAPFNSTKSNLDPDGDPRNIEISDSVKEMIVSRRVIHFGPRVRDVDKQYEINNNADLDNGVYHNFEDSQEEEKSNIHPSQPSNFGSSHQNINDKRIDGSNFDEIQPNDLDPEEQEIFEELKRQGQKKKDLKDKKETELERLENMIQNEEKKEKMNEQQVSLNLVSPPDYDISDREADCGGGNVVTENSNPGQPFVINQHHNVINIKEDQCLKMSPTSSQKSIEGSALNKKPQQHQGMKIVEDSAATNGRNTPQSPGKEKILYTPSLVMEQITHDETILSLLTDFGYPRDYLSKCLKHSDLNYATTSYLLLHFGKMNQLISEHYEKTRGEREEQSQLKLVVNEQTEEDM